MTRAFRDAVRDPKVRAILFRIDSPGGSVIASETIWRAVGSPARRGKPVIVSMGDVAGSGGYYIAAPADKIVAEPATLTGSIGVLAGKVVVAGLLEKDRGDDRCGAVRRQCRDGQRHLAILALRRRPGVQALLDATYQGFKDHVAAGRHMSPDAVEAVAKGRVWTGEDAKAHGLVDALGGYDTALRLAREAARIAPDAPSSSPSSRARGPALLYDRLTGKERATTTPASARSAARSKRCSRCCCGSTP